MLTGVGLVVVPTPRPARADPLPSTPIITVSPDCFTSDGLHPVTISGHNFERNTPVIVTDYVYYKDQDATTQVTTSDYGTFVATLDINANTYYYYNWITVRYLEGDALTSFYVGTCGDAAEVQAVTSCGDPDNPAIHVTGSRFGSFRSASDIRIELRQAETTIGEPIMVPAGRGGTFDVTWQPNVTLVPGDYTVVATQSSLFSRILYVGSDGFKVPCPTITLDPDCALTAGAPPEQMRIFVRGTGFAPNTGSEGEDELEIVFDPRGEAQEFFFYSSSEGGIGEDGTFGPFEINPYARPSATYTIQVKQGGFGNDPDLEQVVTFTVPCNTPTLTLDPTCGPPELVGDESRRYSVRMTGTDFRPDEDITVVFDPDSVAGSNYPPEQFDAVAEKDGTLGLTIEPAYRPPGTYRVLANQETSSGTVQASAPFFVPCFPPAPTIAIDPYCGEVATDVPLAYSINLTGAGFVLGRVDIVFDPTAPVPEAAIAFADELGTVNARIEVTGRPPGSYVVIASQTTVAGLLDQAPARFEVACEGELLTITPTSGERGFVPLVEGFNFPAETALTLRWDRGIGASQPLTVLTDRDGTFHRQVLIFHGDFIGLRHMTVELPTDPLAYPDISVGYVVTQPTVSPPFSPTGNPFAGPDATIVIRR